MKHITPKKKRINKEANQMRRARGSVHGAVCERCYKINEHTLDCFITELTKAFLTEFGAGTFEMHAEGECVDQDQVLETLREVSKPFRIEDWLGK